MLIGPSDIELPIDLNVADFLVNDQITLLGQWVVGLSRTAH